MFLKAVARWCVILTKKYGHKFLKLMGLTKLIAIHNKKKLRLDENIPIQTLLRSSELSPWPWAGTTPAAVLASSPATFPRPSTHGLGELRPGKLCTAWLRCDSWRPMISLTRFYFFTELGDWGKVVSLHTDTAFQISEILNCRCSALCLSTISASLG